MAAPSFEDFISRGLFHDRIVPPLSSLDLANIVVELTAFAKSELTKKYTTRSRLVRHSVPKMKHLRRIFGVPNPYSHVLLSAVIAKHWKRLASVCAKSSVSLSRPVPSSRRALEAQHSRRIEGVRRAKSSVGRKFMLKADIATFYPSIYTHSIPWAIHGKATSRTKRASKWWGNEIDRRVSDTQDRQTGGVPIGPDTSFILAEVIASRMDSMLEKALGQALKGVRYIDDYHLYFSTRSEAERALALLQVVTQEYELQVNGRKTEIVEVPEPIEPSWKTELRLISIRSDSRATNIKAFFDKATELATAYPSDSVLTYAVRKVAQFAGRLQSSEWEVCQSLLLRACIGEPTMLPALLEMFSSHPDAWNSDDLLELLTQLCLYHAPLGHGFEVAWSLWVARELSISLPSSVGQAVGKVNDDIVALVALDLHEKELIADLDTGLWSSRMSADHLYSEHWLLAYEALEHGWLASIDGSDYIKGDRFFTILQSAGIRFYKAEDTWEDGFSDYSDGDDFDEENEEDEEADLDEPVVELDAKAPPWGKRVPMA